MYYFIINPISRSKKGIKVWDIVRSYLDEADIDYKFYYTKYKTHATVIAKKLCEKIKEPFHLVVLGGDGTINEVVNGITDFDKVQLSYIPSGSSNDFARSLHISSDPHTALSTVLTSAAITNVDVGELEILDNNNQVTSTHRFIVSCGIGYDATICYEALHSKLKVSLNKIGLGKLTYGLIAAKQSLTFPQYSCDITVDSNETQHYDHVEFITSMIHPYEGGGAKLVPNAKFDDQKLSFCLVHNMPWYKILLLLPTAFVAKHTKIHGVEIFHGTTLEIKLASAQETHTDGESCGRNLHMRLCCNRHTLQVTTP